jgi:hypothetical protein
MNVIRDLGALALTSLWTGILYGQDLSIGEEWLALMEKRVMIMIFA